MADHATIEAPPPWGRGLIQPEQPPPHFGRLHDRADHPGEPRRHHGYHLFARESVRLVAGSGTQERVGLLGDAGRPRPFPVLARRDVAYVPGQAHGGAIGWLARHVWDRKTVGAGSRASRMMRRSLG